MDKQNPVEYAARANGHAAAEDLVEAPYTGAAGATRIDPMLVTLPDGSVRSVPVYRAVNVGSDPALREPTLAGGLHRFESGEELAIPFVYHDPAAQKLCVVVPEALRHRVLAERAALLTRLADDTAHAIPAYARDATAVVGVAELVAYLARPAGAAETAGRRAALDAREAELTRREEQVGAREERLALRGEGLTSREDELRTREEELEAGQRDLAQREEELAARLEGLRAREEELTAALAAAVEHAASEPLPGTIPPAPATIPPAPATIPPKPQTAFVNLLEEPPSAAGEVESVPDSVPPVPASGSRGEFSVDERIDDQVEELVDDAEVDDAEVAEEIEELDGDDSIEDTGVVRMSGGGTTDAHPLDEARAPAARPSTATPAFVAPEPKRPASGVRAAPVGTVPPPPGFLRDAERELDVLVEDGVRFFVRLDAGRDGAFDVGGELLVQMAVVQGHPVAVLALVATSDEARPYVRRAALDTRDGAQRSVLDALRQRFAARVALYASDGRHLRTIDVAAPREENVALLLERAAKMPEAQVDGATACERALSAPPPVREASQPFTVREGAPAASSARDAAASVARLSSWATPERLDRALLVLSIPRAMVDATFARSLEDAIDFGIALPAALRDRAVTLGLANEPGELVTRQIESFRRASAAKTLGAEETAANWEALLAAAAEFEIAMDSDTHDVAWQAIRAVKGGDDRGTQPADTNPAKLAEMGPPELVLLLDHPRARRAAALELCRRGDAEFVDAVYKAVRKMPRPEVVQVAARVVAFGEASGDALIDGLGARKTFVRQASALVLGQLKLRRAVVPLLHLLQSEESDVWKEVARILGELGHASYRPLLRAAREPKSADDRFAYALAHAANAGSREALRVLARDEAEGEKIMRIAQQAIVREDEARRDAQEVRGERPVDESDPVKAFSRRFYQELAGTAPEADLADL
jgi:hypothetical protein